MSTIGSYWIEYNRAKLESYRKRTFYIQLRIGTDTISEMMLERVFYEHSHYFQTKIRWLLILKIVVIYGKR